MTSEPSNDRREPTTLSRLAFKHVAGTALGAVAVGALVTGIGVYRGHNSRHQIMQGFAGGAILGAISFAGLGDLIYDDTAGILHRRPEKNSFADRVRNSASPSAKSRSMDS